jgi:hypothetical protein
MIDGFEEGTLRLGSPGQGVKVIVNSDDRDDIPQVPPFLLRKLRLWSDRGIHGP